VLWRVKCGPDRSVAAYSFQWKCTCEAMKRIGRDPFIARRSCSQASGRNRSFQTERLDSPHPR
jgi:hypothetical protein